MGDGQAGPEGETEELHEEDQVLDGGELAEEHRLFRVQCEKRITQVPKREEEYAQGASTHSREYLSTLKGCEILLDSLTYQSS